MDPQTPSTDELLAHASWLRPLAARLVGRDAADDVLQETWRTALTRPPGDRRALPGWLKRVTRNAALQHRRSEQARGAREARSARPEGREAADVVERAELHRTLVDEVMALDDPYRTVLLLRWFEDRQPAEIAELTATTAATVRSQLKRGHEKLRERLDRRWQGDRAAWVAAFTPLCEGVGRAATGSSLLGALLMTLKSQYTLPVLFLLLLGGGLAFWLADADGDAGAAAPDLVALDGAGPEPAADAPPARVPVLFGRAPDAPRSRDGAVLGRLVDAASGEALAGAAFALVGEDWPVMRGTTDGRGRFRLAELDAPATYELRFEARDGRVRTLAGVAAEPGRTTDLGTVWLGAPGTLAGLVRDPDGRPVEGAHVRAFRSTLEAGNLEKQLPEVLGALDREPTPLAEARTDARGRFTLAHVPPGVVTLTAAAEGWRDARVQAGVASGATGAQVELVLGRGHTVRGVVVDERGRGVEGAKVAAAPQSSDVGAVLYGRRFAWTDADGRFTLVGLPGGDDLAILAAAPDRPTVYVDVDPAAGEEVRLVLPAAFPLTVRVLVPEGAEPVAGAHVVLVTGEDVDMGGGGPQGLLTGTTDAEGRLVVDAMPGALRVGMFTHDAWGTGMYVGAMGGGMALPGVMRGPEDARIARDHAEITFRFPAGLLVTGRVTDPAGAPIPGARVHTVRMGAPDGPAQAVGADGSYTLRLQPGDGVRAVAPGYWQPQASRAPRPEASAARMTHDIELRPALAVRGRVLLPDGTPAGGALVRLRDLDDEGFGAAKASEPGTITRADGRFVVADVAPSARYRALVRLPGHVDTASGVFAVTPGGATTLEPITLVRGVMVEVIVRDHERAPRAGAQVGLVQDADVQALWDVMLDHETIRRTNAGGVVRFGPVQPGTVTLHVEDPLHLPWKRELDLAGTTEPVHTVHVDLQRGRTLRGHVRAADGRAVKGAVLHFREGTGGGAFARNVDTDAAGRYAVGGLPERPLQVHVRADGFRPAEGTVDATAEVHDVVLTPVDAAKEARRVQLRKRMQEIMLGAGGVQGAEKEALQAELMKIMQELRALDGE